jgi:hypothetical protein
MFRYASGMAVIAGLLCGRRQLTSANSKDADKRLLRHAQGTLPSGYGSARTFAPSASNSSRWRIVRSINMTTLSFTCLFP